MSSPLNYYVIAVDGDGVTHEFIWRLSYWRAYDIGRSAALAERLADACPGYISFRAETISDEAYFGEAVNEKR